LNDIPNATITTSGSSKIVVYAGQKQQKSTLNYQVNGDTLFVEPDLNFDKLISIEIFSKNKVEVINATNSGFQFYEKQLKKLTITLNNAHFSDIYDDSSIMRIDTLLISANKNSSVSINNCEIQNINIIANRSDLNLLKRVHKITGELKNNSHLNCSDAGEISMRKEKGCQINLFE
jgi:hypothetical protein